jgi:acyl carrier protein
MHERGWRLSSVSTRVRDVLSVHGQLIEELTKISDTDDLYEAGMTSHASVSVMLALENEFDVEFPDSQLRRSSFQSVDAICQVLAILGIHDSP